ncbi:MAG TPA: efflux transporter outer membrane subunit, partial [Pseudomonadales bacterium]
LQVLAARSEQARALIGQAEALRLPVLAAGTRTDSTDVTGFDSSNKFGTGAELIWELDVWGKARKGVEAQRAAYQASRADWRAGYLVIVGGVVDTYFQIRRLDRRLVEQRRALEQSRTILDIYRKLYHRGLASSSQLSSQEAELHALRVGLADLERARALAQNALASLIGAVPGEFHLEDTAAKEAIAIPSVPAGLPSDLLSRRPDLLAAEYRLLQAVSLEGQARLSRLPTVGLTGIGGSASFGLSNLLDTWTAGLSSVLQFPVFDPNVRARIRTSEAEVHVAEQQYRASVLRAFEEVESVLINLHSHTQQRADLLARLGKLEDVNRLTRRQLELGLLSHLDVLEQERSLLAAQQAVIDNEWQVLSDTVALFKALGGGWPPEVPGAVAQR